MLPTKVIWTSMQGFGCKILPEGVEIFQQSEALTL
jgi:hypothetical protein